LSIYSVGRLNNPGVMLPDIPYDGWADVRALGVVSGDKALGGLYLGNAAFGAGVGPVGIVATTVQSVGTVRLHDVAATADGWPYLRFAADGRVQVAIAGGALAQANGRPVEVPGVQAVLMGAGSGSSGQSAPAQTIRGRLVRDGVDVTAAIVVPAP
jgi:D-aminopeptidase